MIPTLVGIYTLMNLLILIKSNKELVQKSNIPNKTCAMTIQGIQYEVKV